MIPHIPSRSSIGLVALASLLPAVAVAGIDWTVDPSRAPDAAHGIAGSIQDAIDQALAGDVVWVSPGTYNERLGTLRSGTGAEPITVEAQTPGTVLITTSGRVLDVDHAHHHFVGLTFDGQYGTSNTIKVETAADGTQFRHVEVRRSSRDCVDLEAPSDVLIEDSLIHRCLNHEGGIRIDAHGVVARATRSLVIRNTEIHTFSGDGLQLDPSRSAPGWDDITVEGCLFWLAPMVEAENGLDAGERTGENAIDTKTWTGELRGRMVIRDTVAWGFRDSINNMAAFNLKEKVDVWVDGVTVYDSEIAFRVRGMGLGNEGGAWVRVQNAVIHTVDTGFRYEDEIQKLDVFNTTFGTSVGNPFYEANAESSPLDVRNVLVLGASLPGEAQGEASNMAAPLSVFVDPTQHNYRPEPGSPPIDAGTAISGVDTDRFGVARPQGPGVDIGAFESTPALFEDGFETGSTSRWSGAP